METAKSLYANIVAMIAVIMAALIFAGMPLFYGIDTTVDVAVIVGLFSGTAITLTTLQAAKRAKKPSRRLTARAGA